ncbi:glycosyltransferase [Salinispora arenicola]|uniref:Sterol 3-beta-glucosyltransferase n=1 Tax=Salinispora arenicola (strain CNS-205) TaxID=391037 RepID=A8LXP6_SALAI|nr:glycosyltransferase [Salinispora arenicola]NIL58317.1 glycosyltransferase family 1 protein [Salinispora arenicola]
MRVLVVTVGSRGDVQPYVALGKGLQAAGHHVTLATCARFRTVVTDQGLAYGQLSDDILQLLDSTAGRAAMEDATGVFGSIKTNIKLARQANPINRKLLVDVWAAAQQAEPDVIVYHPKALAGPHVAEKLGVPVVLALPVPVSVPTGDFPLVGLPALPLGRWYNRLTYRLAGAGYRMYDGMVNAFRRETLGLARTSGAALTTRLPDGRPIPVLHGISEHVLPRPADWPAHVHLTGYWFLDGADRWQPPPALVDFIEAGDPPVYVGFGSMAGRDPHRLTRVVGEALRLAGVRGIITTGWGGLEMVEQSDTNWHLTQAPHDWLFPRVSAVVHHGGAGTTAAALRAGKPSVICPFILDQFVWGRQVFALGAGSAPIPQRKLTAQRLAAAIREVTTNADVQGAAARLGRSLAAEDGVANAVARIDAVLDRAG